jgi:hypothetical protein
VKVDLAKEARRGRAARAELALVREHIDSERERLFNKFCDPRSDDELYLLREEAQALTKVEEFLEQLVIGGELAERTEGDA